MTQEPIEFASFGEERDPEEVEQALYDAASSGNVQAIELYQRNERLREFRERAKVEAADPARREGQIVKYDEDRAIINDSLRWRWLKNAERMDRLMDQAEQDVQIARGFTAPDKQAELSMAAVRTTGMVCQRIQEHFRDAQGPAQSQHLHLHDSFATMSADELRNYIADRQRALAGGNGSSKAQAGGA